MHELFGSPLFLSPHRSSRGFLEAHGLVSQLQGQGEATKRATGLDETQSMSTGVFKISYFGALFLWDYTISIGVSQVLVAGWSWLMVDVNVNPTTIPQKTSVVGGSFHFQKGVYSW